MRLEAQGSPLCDCLGDAAAGLGAALVCPRTFPQTQTRGCSRFCFFEFEQNSDLEAGAQAACQVSSQPFMKPEGKVGQMSAGPSVGPSVTTLPAPRTPKLRNLRQGNSPETVMKTCTPTQGKRTLVVQGAQSSDCLLRPHGALERPYSTPH